jgi:hypothetical protein
MKAIHLTAYGNPTGGHQDAGDSVDENICEWC